MTKRVYKVRSVDSADWDRDPELEGTIKEFGSLAVDDKERPFMVIDTGMRKVRVFDSKALEEAFEKGEPGDHIRLEYRGKVKVQGGKTFKRFNVQVWTEEEGEGDEEKKDASV